MLADEVESDTGAIAVFVALLIPVLLIFTAFAVDISRWYVEMQRLQKTVDAAALAGAPFMPEAITGTDVASDAARKAITQNGFDPGPAVIQVGERPSQLRVTLSSTVSNAFASLIGKPTTLITRSAVGEFSGPAPLWQPVQRPWQRAVGHQLVHQRPSAVECRTQLRQLSAVLVHHGRS